MSETTLETPLHPADRAAPAALAFRTMRDSTKPAQIPVDSQMAAGYVDGSYQWAPEDWDRFPQAEKVRITVEPFNRQHVPTGYPSGDYLRASVIDVETGAFSPADAARFLPARNRFRPETATAYCNKSTLPAVLRACRGHIYWLWLAWFLDRLPTVAELAEVAAQIEPYGVRLAAVQHTPGPAFDTSAVYAAGWHKGTHHA